MAEYHETRNEHLLEVDLTKKGGWHGQKFILTTSNNSFVNIKGNVGPPCIAALLEPYMHVYICAKPLQMKVFPIYRATV